MTRASMPGKRIGFEFQTSDLDEFCEVVSKSIRPCRFLARSARYNAELRHNSAGALGFSIVSLGPDIGVNVNPVEDSYLFQYALAGSFRARCNGPERTFGHGDLHVVNPSAPLQVSLSEGGSMLVMRVPKSTLEDHARVLADASVDGACLLPEALPTASPEAASLWRYLQFLHAESMASGSALREGAASRSAEQLLASMMLATAEPGGARARPAGPEGRAVEGHVRRAEEYIDGHIDDDIGLVDIVGAAGVDARTLDSGFRRRRGAGPLSWLDRHRSERTARELGPRARPGELAPPSAGDGRPRLTARELEIAQLVAAGFNNLEIATGLAISRNTVKEALKRIFRKVDVDSRAELVLRLSEARLL